MLRLSEIVSCRLPHLNWIFFFNYKNPTKECARGINTTWEKSADRKAEMRKACVPLTGLICAFQSADFLRWCLSPERNLTQSLFLFPIVFGINLIHFFDEKKDGAAGNLIVCFGASILSRHLTEAKVNEEWELFRRVQRFGNGKCELSAIQEGRNKGVNFWQGKVQNSSPIPRCKFLARKSAKLIANFSATKVTSLPSPSLYLSLSLSHTHTHTHWAHVAHNIRSASALPIIQKKYSWKKTYLRCPIVLHGLANTIRSGATPRFSIFSISVWRWNRQF